MMKVYKRSMWVIFKELVYAPAAGFVVYLAAGFFTSSAPAAYGISALVALAIACLAISGGNVRFELEPGGAFRYYKGGKLQNSHDITKCHIGYHCESVSGLWGSDDIELRISDRDSRIDCSPLGPGRFHEMFEEMEKLSKNTPGKLSAATER
ncbi:MAG: hypothetical protein LBD67_04475 [Candidatus Accumulibacter sp.]|jgi:hypothetical protein|nr:hypothetical protein [Accumulibacter sp.]